MRKIENLVFQGGGVLGIAYTGAIHALERANLLGDIKRVAGTSAGSIVATLLSLKYAASEITEIIKTTDFKEFEDHKDYLRIPTKYGLYKGDYFLSWIKDLIRQKTNNEDITFSELSSKGYLDLKVFATDLNTANVREFSNEKTPHVIVAESLRASMAFPLFFSAWKFPNNNPNDHIYVDGGVVYDYPINAFEDLSKTLGFFLDNNETQASDLGYNQFTQYIKRYIHTLISSQDVNFNVNPRLEEITVRIDDFGISSLNFYLSDKMKNQLYKSGLKATTEYINHHLK